MEEVERYVAENGIKTDAGRFYAFYKMKGWKDSAGNPVEDWKAALDYWVTFERERKKNKGKGNGSIQKGKRNSYCCFEERPVSGDELDDLERALLKRGCQGRFLNCKGLAHLCKPGVLLVLAGIDRIAVSLFVCCDFIQMLIFGFVLLL